MNSRISVNPSVCHGKPVIAGTRVLVANILAELATGADFDAVRSSYPNITSEDILAALEHRDVAGRTYLVTDGGAQVRVTE